MDPVFYLIAQDEYYPQKALADWHGPFRDIDSLILYAESVDEEWQIVVRILYNVPQVIWTIQKPEYSDFLDRQGLVGVQVPHVRVPQGTEIIRKGG